MQNTMVRGGVEMEKGKEKRRKITLKKGEKAFKMHLFGLKLKFSPRPPQTNVSGKN